MATLARKAAKAILFFVLYFFAIRYIHTYPMPMTQRQQHYLIVTAGLFGITDIELFYIVAMVVIDLCVTIAVYSLLLKLWRRYRVKA